MTMQKSTVSTIAATPTTPVLVVGVIMLLLLSLLSYTSSGVIRGGDEDEGSGFGGTGRMSVPSSESGLGGTGFKPYLGFNEQLNEIEINRPLRSEIAATAPQSILTDLNISIEPRQQVLPEPVETAVVSQPAQSFTRDSGPIEITEQIQRSFDANALQFERLRASAASSANLTKAPENSIKDELAQELKANSSSQLLSENHTDLPQAESPVDEQSESQESPASISWLTVAKFIAESRDSKGVDINSLASLDNSDSAQDSVRVERPNRIQRPELPPIQRARPLQRLNILPPQVRPLSL